MRLSLSPVATVIMALCVAVWGGAFLLDATGALPNAQRLAIGFGGLWPQLLEGMRGLFPGQEYTMFLTHGFVHAGLLHLGMNMFALAIFDRDLRQVARPGVIALIYGASQIGGGLAYGLMAREGVPVVGASGAIFGLAGAQLSMAALILYRRGDSLRVLAGPLTQFIILNLVLTFAVPSIAWQAHLGGALTGLVLGALFAPRPHRS